MNYNKIYQLNRFYWKAGKTYMYVIVNLQSLVTENMAQLQNLEYFRSIKPYIMFKENIKQPLSLP